MLDPLSKVTSNRVNLNALQLNKMPSIKLSRLWSAIILLPYPDINEDFKTHSDDSNFQLWVVIR